MTTTQIVKQVLADVKNYGKCSIVDSTRSYGLTVIEYVDGEIDSFYAVNRSQCLRDDVEINDELTITSILDFIMGVDEHSAELSELVELFNDEIIEAL